MDLRVGQVLVETYRIERLIAEGGMGSVYEATHLRVPKRYAVKFLNLSLVDKAEALVRFRREAEIIAALNHPNVVGLFDYNVTDDGVPYIVLEYLDGEHLGKRLDRGKIALSDAIRITVPVAHALAAAHKRNIVHRDLKPENIILCKGELVKVVDFGIAKICGYDLTGLNSIIGTVPYMSPEQIGGGAIDGRADQFALGSIVYEMLSGQMAFGGSQSVPEVAMRVMHHQPPFIEGVAQSVNEAIFRAMAKEPAKRFADLETFLKSLLDAASRPDDASVVVSESLDEEEGLPPLAGEATTLTGRALDHDAEIDTELAEPPEPASRADGAQVPVSSEIDLDGKPPLTEQATMITRPTLPSDGGDTPPLPIAAQPTVVAPSPTLSATTDGADGKPPLSSLPTMATTKPPPAPPLAKPPASPSDAPSSKSKHVPSKAEGPPPVPGAKPPVPYTNDAYRFKPLVTQNIATVDGIEETPAGQPPDPVEVPLASAATAITRKPTPPPIVGGAPAAIVPPGESSAGLRVLHAAPTVQQPILDTEGAGPGIRETAQLQKSSVLPLRPDRPDHTDNVRLTAFDADAATDPKRPAAEDRTGMRKLKSPLAMWWLALATAAAVIVIGLVVRLFIHH